MRIRLVRILNEEAHVRTTPEFEGECNSLGSSFNFLDRCMRRPMVVGAEGIESPPVEIKNFRRPLET